MRKDDATKVLILNSVSEYEDSQLVDSETAKEMWGMLEEQNCATSESPVFMTMVV